MTTTLAEFLLTRIAVDEDGLARTYADMAEVMGNQGRPLLADWLMAQRTRVLAECEAKRRIVTLATALADHDDMGSSTREDGESILAALALPYSDHADYRAEWAA